MRTFILDTRTATPHFPGIGRYVANLERELPLLLDGNEQLVLLGEGETRRQGDKETGRLEISSSPFSITQQWQVPKALRTISRNTQHATRNVDSAFRIPHSALLYHSPYYLMPYRPGVPTVLTFYDAIPLLYPEYVSLRARLLFRLTTCLACRAANHIVSISDASSRDLQQFFGVPASKIITTPLAPDPRFQPQSSSEIERIRTKYNLPENFLLYFGINKPHKNLLALVDAYSQFAIRNSQFAIHLVIAGAWDERYPEAKERAQSLGDAVHFLGRIDDADLPGLYSAATAFIFPSKYEGFGLPILEAMACGTPVACSNTSSLPEVTGDAALLFDPQNIGEIALAMQQLINDSLLRNDLRQKGLAQTARFTWRRTAEATLDVYRNVCGKAAE